MREVTEEERKGEERKGNEIGRKEGKWWRRKREKS